MTDQQPHRITVRPEVLDTAIEILKGRFADDAGDVEAHSFDDDEGQGITVTIIPTF